MRVSPERIQKVKTGPYTKGPVVYWMSRDQRIFHNWALLHAQDLALDMDRELRILFCLAPGFLGAGFRQYDFMLKGLQECFTQARELNIPFDLICGEPEISVPSYLDNLKPAFLVMDFDPLRIKRDWQKKVLDNSRVSACLVDAHNIVPVWTASSKQEYAARTIRPRIHKKLAQFLEPVPEVAVQKKNTIDFPNKPDFYQHIPTHAGKPVDWIKPGTAAGLKQLDLFLAKRISSYSGYRNDPNREVLSDLSPYLHFGQICSQTVALEVQKNIDIHPEDKDAFLEEIIIRKELADNFCHFNPDYDNFHGLPQWGQKTLNKHRIDPRPYLYSLEDLESSSTHDALWNAAQQEMIVRGKMHGYMRMYWAKKILEWTRTPEEAISWAVYLNDKYELDGRDPNGYTGILWSMGGLHDRPWKERQIFGTVRYMSYEGCKRKFNINEYIEKWNNPGRRS
ncbi:deoxyribodipyrimidine photo-lyase [Desulfonatronovibrio hydrogenovorans]|uniref:deoxyribodipyrimidine photo-lyase n=1 Tax=Desulfonatronovibrio hydrogenovorans TaxID=53245 RepID=UPI00048EEB27|nr:deoxyribodipyrimidine photo-lyase [Desulfonatronovibrio hydrogenovorans]